MKRTVYRVASTVVIFGVLAAVALGQGFTVMPSYPEPSYPQFILDPRSPQLEDSVSLDVILDVHPNSCVPSYTTSFAIEKVNENVCISCPQEFILKVDYSEESGMTNPGEACAQVLTPYGPRFEFASLQVGTYTVVENKDSDTLLTFTVGQDRDPGFIRGIVSKDREGQETPTPIGGARVYLQRPDYMVLQNTITYSEVVSWPFVPQTMVDSAITGENGGFEFTGLEPSLYSIRVRAEGYQAKTLGVSLPSDSLVSIPLLPLNSFAAVEGKIRGRSCSDNVMQDGIVCPLSALEGCTVSVAVYGWGSSSPVVESGSVMYMPQRLYHAVTDAQGSYRIDSIPLTQNGEIAAATVTKTGYAPRSVDTILNAGASTLVNFDLQADAAVDIALERPEAGVEQAGVIQFSPKDQMLSIRVDRAQMVSIDAFLSNGRREGRLSTSRHFGPGVYRFSMDSESLGAGMVIVRVQGEDFEETRRINLTRMN